jgi:AcrR family transcriptional regulator
LPLKDQEIKTEILHNFRKAAAEKGFKKVSLDRLAAEMVISKKTIYKYFPGKEDLVAACLNEINDELDKSVKDIFEEQHPSRDMLVSALIKIFIQMSANVNILQDLHRYYPELWSVFDERRAARIKLAERFIEKGIAAGQFHNVNVKVALFSYVAAVRTVINPSFLKTNKIEFNEAYESLITLFLNGLLMSP